MNIKQKIKNNAISLYAKFIYLAFQEVCSDDFSPLAAYIEEHFGVKDYLDRDTQENDFLELLGMIGYIEKEYKTKFDAFKQKFINDRIEWKNDIDYIAIETLLKESECLFLLRKEIPFLVMLILENRIKKFSRYDEEINLYDLNKLNLVSKNGFISIERNNHYFK